jgi:hypothetical protein
MQAKQKWLLTNRSDFCIFLWLRKSIERNQMLKLHNYHSLQDSSRYMTLFRHAPCRRSISFYYEEDANYYLRRNIHFKNRYFLSFPDILFAVYYQNNLQSVHPYHLRVAFTDQYLLNLFPVPLPNGNENSFSFLVDGLFHEANQDTLASQIMSVFWESHFNMAGGYMLYDATNRGCEKNTWMKKFSEFLLDWEQKTKSNRFWKPKEDHVNSILDLETKPISLESFVDSKIWKKI